MERSRAWPWKKKITDKLASAALEFKQSNEQLDARIDLKDQALGMTPLQQAEARLRILTEQLTAKNEVVLQHAKVAEEAVSGWEKAESETANVRELLEAETQKRLASEDQVAHLDGALKECMRQLRHVREQQEQKIYDALAKNTREWEEVRGEMEAKMAKLANQLLEAEAEKVAMTKLLQERAKAIQEAKEGRKNAEEMVKLLQVKLETAEKDQTKWKYELHVLSKELQIRNEELDYNKKASELANKQHLENVKKVAKLETECQRLRLLVRKKLPGPAAISQMRMEVEALGLASNASIERGRRMSPSRRSKSNVWKPDRGETPWPMNGDADEEQFLAMEEENRALREALSKSNNELQAARMLFERTTTKLSATDLHLENASMTSSSHGLSREKHPLDGYMSSRAGERSQGEPSVASVSEDGAEIESSCAESWATGLVSELTHFHKEKGSSITSPILDSSCDLMDDFAEMEKLASMPPDNHASLTGNKAGKKHLGDVEDQPNVQGNLSASDEKIHSLCKSCKDLQRKLGVAEDELNVVRLQRLSARATLASIEKQLVVILQSGERASLTDTLEEVRSALNEPSRIESKSTHDTTAFSDRSCMEMETAEVRDTRVWSPSDLSSCPSEESTSKQESPLATIKVNTIRRELVTAMHKVASLIDSLSQVDFDILNSDIHHQGDKRDSLGQDDASKQWRSSEPGSELTSCVQSLITLCNGILHSKVDMMDFLVEITSALDWLVSHLFSTPVHETNGMRRRLGLDKGSVSPHGSQRIDMVPSPPVSVRKIGHSNGGSEDTLPSLPGGLSGNEHERSFDVHRKRTQDLIEQLNQLKAEKEGGDEKLKLLTSELEASKAQLEDSRVHASHLEATLKSALDSKASLAIEMAGLASTKSSLESELVDAREEIKKLEERARSLEVQLQDETQCRKDIEAMYQDLLGRWSCSTMDKKQGGVNKDEVGAGEMSTDEPAANARKEQEIAAAAEKLAECQQTILALGKQLKGLGLPTSGGDQSPAPRLSSYKSPMNEHRSHSMCDQLPSVYGRVADSANTSPIGFHQPIGEEDGSFSADERTRSTSSLHGSLRGHHDGRHGGLSYGGYTDASRVGTSCEALLSPDRSRGPPTRSNEFIVSPDSQSSRRTELVPSKELALTSPGRSPARFLTMKRRGGGDANKPADGSSSEKQAMGFTRFFSRNKGSK